MKKQEKKIERAVEKSEATKKVGSKLKTTYGLGAHQMLKKQNPYYQTIEDPIHMTGVKIPDLDISDSEAFYQRLKFTLVTNANGEGVVVVGFYGLGATYRPSLIPKPGTGWQYYIGNANNDPTMTVANLLAGTTIPFTYPQWNATTPTVPNKYTHARVVSAALSAQVLAATNLSSGKLSGAFFPKDKLSKVMGVGNLSLVIVENQQDSMIMPLNEFKPFVLRYKPVDKSCLEYWPLDQTPTSAIEAGQDGSEVGTFVVAISGGQPNSVTQFILHVNYEGLVRDVTYSSGGTKSAYVDSNALDHAFQEISTLPSATSNKSVQFEQNRSGPISSTPQMNVSKPPKPVLETLIDSVPAILEKGTGIIDKMAPFLALL
jgi:hypothetical protein